MKKLHIIIHLTAILIVIPCFLIGVLLHLVGGIFKTFGYLFQFDKESAAEVWMDIYYHVKKIKY